MAKGKKVEKKFKSSLYRINDEKAERLKKTCPKCGEGVFMADHKNRLACGKCGYTEFKKGS